MLDVRFFRNPRFSAASATITLAYFALFGSTFLLTQYFQFVLGYSPLKAGLHDRAGRDRDHGGAPQAPKLVDRFGTKASWSAGLMIVAVALLLYASDSIMSSWCSAARACCCSAPAWASSSAPATESIMGSLPTEKAGVGSAVNDTTRQTGGALGVAVLGSIFAARYRSTIDVPGGLTAAQDHDMRDSIGRARRRRPGRCRRRRPRSTTPPPTRSTQAMQLVYPIAAVVVLAAAVLAWRYLPARASGRVTEPVVESRPRPGQPLRSPTRT